MKKFILLVNCLSLVLFLSSCSTGNNNDEKTQSQESSSISSNSQNIKEKSFTEEDMIFYYKEKKMFVKENMETVLADIGQPIKYTASKSCNYVGEDKAYEYDGFTIYTYPEGDNDYILEIELNKDNVSTVKGAKVGMKLNDFIALYGDNYVKEGINYKYSLNDSKYMYCSVENGVVETISLANEN